MQKKIENIIPQDKALHAIGGNIAYCVVRMLSQLFLSRELSILISCLAVALVGIGKEIIIDKWIRNKEIDWWDTVATILGAVPSIITDLVND